MGLVKHLGKMKQGKNRKLRNEMIGTELVGNFKIYFS